MQKLIWVLKIWGFFEKGLGFLILWKFSSKFWLGCVPFDICVFVLALCGILIMYWGIFTYVHTFFIYVVLYCMLSVWQNVLVTFLCWIGLKWVPLLGFTLDWTCVTCFGQWMCVLHTLTKLCVNAMPCIHYAHTGHPLGTPYASPTALTCISSCTHMHSTDTHAQSCSSCIMLIFTCFNAYSKLF